MYVRFQASESVNIAVTEKTIPIQHYLRQSQRLVEAISNPQLRQQISEDTYQLKMRSINFMEIYHFQPIVLLKVWSGANGIVYLQSKECRIEGIDYINRRFSLQLKGILLPKQNGEKTYLEGKADLEVGVEIPTALMLTPKPLLEIAGNQLLKSVLVRIKQRLLAQLLQDYYLWADRQATSNPHLGTELSTDFGC
jgi:hypothetical protein